MAKDADRYRVESDPFGQVRIPADSLWGVHTMRAISNFPLSGRPVNPALIHAFGEVKLAAVQVNRELGVWDSDSGKAEAMMAACREMADGQLDSHVVVDALQGGAGTSTNMNVNEVIANRATQILGLPVGQGSGVSSLDDVNLHQSTNDTYPTALRIGAIRGVRRLDASLVSLQEAFQDAERRFADVVKLGRTQLQDAVLTTLGREMGAYAEAFGRDRWRVYKCEERLRVVNLGGTAIGTGLGAPRKYIFRVVDVLRQNTGIGLARAENLVESTQNADVFVEVSGILKACAVSLIKVSSDLRLMSSGPDGGIGEIRLPACQAGSSIMPGKVNPVIPEAVTQAAMKVMGNDTVIAHACSMGVLELNPFLPIVADALLESIDLLINACEIFRRNCISGLEANVDACRAHVDSSTAVATALIPLLGYSRVSELVSRARATGRQIKEIAIVEGFVTAQEYDMLLTPEAVKRLGW